MPVTDPLCEGEVDGLEITLPSGAVYEDPTGQGHDRGFGWEYVAETTSITRAEIEHVIDNADHVVTDDGEFQYVIGEGLSEQEKVILSIIGGMIAAAEGLDRPVEHDTSESNCNTEDFTVETDNDRGKEGNPEHTLRDEKPVNDRNTLDDIIENPDRILDFDDRRYLVKALDDGVSVLRLNKNHKYDAVFELVTQLTDSNELYDSLEDATDDIVDNTERGEKPSRNVRC